MVALVRPGMELVNRLLLPYVAKGPRPAFWDISKICPELDRVTAAYPAIRREAEQLVAGRDDLPSYESVDQRQSRIAGTTPNRWSVFFLNVFGILPDENRVRCPKTCAVLDRVPNLLQAFFSILDPGKSIPEHSGPYLGFLRYHLALIVPTDHPPVMTVNGESHVWREGHAIMFDDSLPHRVDNQSEFVRVVLIVDVRRPLPAIPDLVNRFMTGAIARWTYGRSIIRRLQRQGAG